MALPPADLGPLIALLRTKARGEAISISEVCQATGWSADVIDALLRDHTGASLLRRSPSGELHAVSHGSEAPRRRPRVARSFRANPGATVETDDGIVYELKRALGEGGVGAVWSATSRSGETVALKFFAPRSNLVMRAPPDELLRRFLREGRNGLKLRNDSLLRIHEVIDSYDPPFLVMDHGDYSANRVARQSQRTRQRRTALAIATNVARALMYLHDQKCVHRDVKPANIIFVRNRWVLGDLGIVKWSDLNPDFTTAAAITNQDAGQLGSMHYMAPEQSTTPHKVDPASDVYALAISWYELSEGNLPAPAQVYAGRFRPHTGFAPMDELITRMTRYDSHDRPSISEVLAFLLDLATSPRAQEFLDGAT